MSYIDKMSKNGVSYDIQDARLANLQSTVTDLNKIKDLSGEDGDVLAFNAEGGIEGKTGFLQSTDILDEDTGLILDEKIPAGFVKSVNNIAPVNNNVTLTRVPLADNLYSDDNVSSVDTFMFRTAGGEESVDSGEAVLTSIEGHASAIGRASDVLTYEASSESTPTFAVTSINKDTFISNAAISGTGEYTFEYDGSNWTLNGNNVVLSNFGITTSAMSEEVAQLTAVQGTGGNYLVDFGDSSSGLAILRQAGLADGTHIFYYDGNSSWYLNGSAVSGGLWSTYGIRVKAGEGQSAAVLPTATFAATTQAAAMTVTADIDVYRTCTNTDLYNGLDKTITFSYNGDDSEWKYQSPSTGSWVTANLSEVGITVVGTPLGADEIIMTYSTGGASISLQWQAATSDAEIVIDYTAYVRGTLAIARPTGFKAIGFNQYDKTNNTLTNYTVNASGQIVASTGTSIAIVHVAGGVVGSTNVAGYAAALLEETDEFEESTSIENSSSLILSCWFDTTRKTSGTISTQINNTWSGTDAGGDRRTIIDFGDDDGYLYIVLSSSYVDNLVVHPAWSEQWPNYYDIYRESTIDFTGFKGKINGEGSYVDLPLNIYGMPSVGTYYESSLKDKLDFDRGEYIQKVERLAYSAANLTIVQNYAAAYGTPYDYDDSYILKGLREADYVTYKVYADTSGTAISGAYEVNDYGTEEFEYYSGTTPLSMLSNFLYGASLKDKLRSDVLTKSAMSLTSAQQSVCRNNIGAISSTELNNALANINYLREECELTSNIGYLEPNKEMTISTPLSANLTLYLNAPVSDHATEWRVVLISNASASNTITLGGAGDFSPTFRGDDVTLSSSVYTITLDADTYYEISFGLLVNSVVGVVVKAWDAVTDSASE